MKKKRQTKISVQFSQIKRLNLLVLFFCASLTIITAQNHFELIAQRVIKYNKEMTTTLQLDANVDKLLELYTEGTYDLGSYYNRLVTGAYFSSIDYTSRERASWPVVSHVVYMQYLADAYTRADSKYFGDEAIFYKFEKLLKFWYEANVTSLNWWAQSIGVPKPMTLALLYMEYGSEKKVDEDVVAGVLHRIRTTSRTNPASEAGPNKTDMALHWLNRALIRQNTDTLNLAAKYSFDPLVLVDPSAEGIQRDYSYFQHGSQLQIASYGGELMNTTVAFLEFFNGTQFAIADSKLELFSEFARKTFFGNMRGQYFPYMLTGRGVTRSNNTYRPAAANYARSLMNTDPIHKQEYEAIAKRLEKTASASQGIVPSSKLYHIGDYISHNRPEYQYTIRAVSSRTLRSEWGNQEGFETYFMSDASNAILQDGDEYENIYGVWDWAKVPGVTNPWLPRGHVPNSQTSMDAGASTPGIQPFVGGVSDNLYSAYTYTLYDGWSTNNRAGKYVEIATIAKKSWFMFDKEVVAIGSGLTCNATHADLGDLELVTTINQALLKGDILVGLANGNVEKLTLGDLKEYQNAKWIVHNNIGYVLPQGGLIKVEAATRSGAWYEINESQSRTEESKDLFALWLSHGKKAKDEKYTYLVVPNIANGEEMQAYCNNDLKDIEIIVNNDDIQAVRHQSLGIWQIIFRNATLFKHNDLAIKADQPCAVMMKDIDVEGKTATMYVADVMQYGKVLTFGVDIPGYTSGLKAVSVDNTTSGVQKGKSIEVLLDNTLTDYVSPEPQEPPKPILFQYQTVATADTYVDGRTENVDTNYGQMPTMTTKNDIPSWAREAYIELPLDDLDKVDDLDKYDLEVSLNLYLLRTNADVATTTWTLQPMSEGWDETTTTWNTKPTYEGRVVGQTSAFTYNSMLGEEYNVANSVSINFTEYAIEEYKAGKRKLSLLIYNGISGGKVDADFATREHSNEVMRPKITVKGYEKENKVLLQTKTINATQDVYVKNGNGQNVNYGGDAVMPINTGGAGYHREAYLMFPMADLNTIQLEDYETKIYMSLYQFSSQPDAAGSNWDVRAATETNWSENTITWNNRPLPGSEVIASLPGFVNYKEGGFQEKYIALFDITSYTIAQAMLNNDNITLNIKGASSAGNSSKYVSNFATKEYKLDGINIDERTVPKLIVELYEKKIKPQISVVGIAAKDKLYDGTTFAELDLNNIKLAGVSEGDEVEIDFSDIYIRFENAEVGEDKVVFANGLVMIKGRDAYKYQLKQPSLNTLVANINYPKVIILIDEQEVDIVDNKAYYLVDRDNTQTELDLVVEGVDVELPAKLDISKPSVQIIEFEVRDSKYTLTVEKRFFFQDLVSMRWNNTLTVKNTPHVHGFEFIAYQWYENGLPIVGATGQSYSAGRNGERLNGNSLYHVSVTDKNTNHVLRTWDSKVELTSAVIAAYPNPVQKGATLTISANLTDEQLKGAQIYIYSTGGAQIATHQITESVTHIPMPLTAGLYVVSLRNNSGIIKSFNIIVD